MNQMPTIPATMEANILNFEKFLKAEQELAMARMKFAEKRMR